MMFDTNLAQIYKPINNIACFSDFLNVLQLICSITHRSVLTVRYGMIISY